jgi:hypothetical protein
MSSSVTKASLPSTVAKNVGEDTYTQVGKIRYKRRQVLAREKRGVILVACLSDKESRWTGTRLARNTRRALAGLSTEPAVAREETLGKLRRKMIRIRCRDQRCPRVRAGTTVAACERWAFLLFPVAHLVRKEDPFYSFDRESWKQGVDLGLFLQTSMFK